LSTNNLALELIMRPKEQDILERKIGCCLRIMNQSEDQGFSKEELAAFSEKKIVYRLEYNNKNKWAWTLKHYISEEGAAEEIRVSGCRYKIMLFPPSDKSFVKDPKVIDSESVEKGLYIVFVKDRFPWSFYSKDEEGKYQHTVIMAKNHTTLLNGLSELVELQKRLKEQPEEIVITNLRSIKILDEIAESYGSTAQMSEMVILNGLLLNRKPEDLTGNEKKEIEEAIASYYVDRTQDLRIALSEGAASFLVYLTSKMPRDYITEDGFGITEKCRHYLEPLICGEAYPPYINGLPQYVKLKNILKEKKLDTVFHT